MRFFLTTKTSQMKTTTNKFTIVCSRLRRLQSLEKIRYLNSYRLSASLEAADKYTDNLLKYSSQENKESIKSIKTFLKDLKQKIDSVQTLGRQLSDAIQGFVNGMDTDDQLVNFYADTIRVSFKELIDLQERSLDLSYGFDVIKEFVANL